MFRIDFLQSWENRFMREEGISREELDSRENEFNDKIINIMTSLTNNWYSKVKVYPYCTAGVRDTIFDADHNGDGTKIFEYMLALKAHVHTDNHVVYEVYDGCKTIYVWCHDGLMRFARELIIYKQ